MTSWLNSDFRNIWACLGLTYCNAVTPITDLVCALSGPHAAMFVNRIYPGKSLKTSFVSPGKPWNLVFASPRKSVWTLTLLTVHHKMSSIWRQAAASLLSNIALVYGVFRNMASLLMCCGLACQKERSFCRFTVGRLIGYMVVNNNSWLVELIISCKMP